MLLKTIEEEWQIYSGMIFANLDPPAVQVSETQRAFFAGALAILKIAEMLGASGIPEDEGADYLQRLLNEAVKFSRDRIRRYAEGN